MSTNELDDMRIRVQQVQDEFNQLVVDATTKQDGLNARIEQLEIELSRRDRLIHHRNTELMHMQKYDENLRANNAVLVKQNMLKTGTEPVVIQNLELDLGILVKYANLVQYASSRYMMAMMLISAVSDDETIQEKIEEYSTVESLINHIQSPKTYQNIVVACYQCRNEPDSNTNWYNEPRCVVSAVLMNRLAEMGISHIYGDQGIIRETEEGIDRAIRSMLQKPIDVYALEMNLISTYLVAMQDILYKQGKDRILSRISETYRTRRIPGLEREPEDERWMQTIEENDNAVQMLNHILSTELWNDVTSGLMGYADGQNMMHAFLREVGIMPDEYDNCLRRI